MIKLMILFMILYVLLVSPIVSAIRINEVELNPPGHDSGNEWVELYSENKINLSSYKLINNDGDEINLSGSFKGYLVYIFKKQWLDNSDERIYLYEGKKLIDKTILFKDSKNNNLTWSYCEKWKFNEPTENKENNCKKKKIKKEVKKEVMIKQDRETKNKEIKDKRKSIKKYTEKINLSFVEKKPNENKKQSETSVIKLIPKDIKTEENNKNLRRNYARIEFMVFFVLLVFLFILRRNKFKNEFS